ncbi:MAG TPA: hypothetical protein VJ672_02140 [Gemmatimonadaceae bacterium]|nr:hypothetical protein [Gemmatimonadaceae bacterium]
MNLEQWLDERTPVPPPALAERVRQALGNDLERPASDASAACLDAAERLLVRVLARADADRETASDLLCVDALVTYAYESAADTPASLETEVTFGMRRLGALADRA